MDRPIPMITVAQLRAARALLGIDQRTLAEQAGVSVPTIQRMESGQGIVRGLVGSVVKVVEALESAGVELIGENGQSLERWPGGQAARGSRGRARGRRLIMRANASALNEAAPSFRRAVHAQADHRAARGLRAGTVPRRPSGGADGRGRCPALVDGDRDRVGRVAGAGPHDCDRRRVHRLGAWGQPVPDRRSGGRLHRSGRGDRPGAWHGRADPGHAAGRA